MTRTTKRSFNPQFESLEDRTVPTTATLDNGMLTILGTSKSDSITIKQTINHISITGVAEYFLTSKVTGITIMGLEGNDRIDAVGMNLSCTIHGGAGNDFIIGSGVADVLFGEDGNDRLFGKYGNDTLYGGDGNDLLFGNQGTDALYGQAGDDFLDDGNPAVSEATNGGSGMDWIADVVAINGTSMSDVNQTAAPSCGFLSSLQGLANNRYDFTKNIKYNGYRTDGTPSYQVKLFSNGAWKWHTVDFTGSLTATDTAPAVEGESWVVLMQRAWIQQHGKGGRCWPHEAILALTGSAAKSSRYQVVDSDFNAIQTALAGKKLVVGGTHNHALSTSYLVSNHAYTVIGTFGFKNDFLNIDTRFVILRNPWGKDGGIGDSHPDDGVVILSWKEFKANMQYLAIQ